MRDDRPRAVTSRDARTHTQVSSTRFLFFFPPALLYYFSCSSLLHYIYNDEPNAAGLDGGTIIAPERTHTHTLRSFTLVPRSLCVRAARQESVCNLFLLLPKNKKKKTTTTKRFYDLNATESKHYKIYNSLYVYKKVIKKKTYSISFSKIFYNSKRRGVPKIRTRVLFHRGWGNSFTPIKERRLQRHRLDFIHYMYIYVSRYYFTKKKKDFRKENSNFR